MTNIKDKFLDLLDVIIYLLVGIYMLIKGILTDNGVFYKVMFYLLGIFFIFISFQILNQKKLYNKALYQLNYELNPVEANKTYDKIVKHDFLKIYTKQRGFFDLMLLMEMKEYKKAKWIIEMNEKKLDSNDDMRFLKHYYLLKIAYANKDKQGVLSNYSKINDLYGKVKKHSFIKEEADALAFYVKGQKKDALDCLKTLNLDSLCPKDKKQILEELIDMSIGNEKEMYKKEYDELINLKRGNTNNVYN
jgi:hypothetical protein